MVKFYLFILVKQRIFFWDRISLCSPGWPQIIDPSASASQVLKLQAWTTIPDKQINLQIAQI
jgi:hypothetical protein